MKKRIKIVYVLEATSGGTRRHITQILTHLDLDKFEPLLFCSTKRDPAFMRDIELFRQRGVKVLTFPMKRSIAPISDPLSIIKMTEAMKREKPDIVHTHSSKAGIIGRLAAKNALVPGIIHTPHVFPFEMALSPLKRSFYLLCERHAAKFTDLLLAVSEAEKNVAIESGLFPKEKTSVIHNGIDPDLWNKNGIECEKRPEKADVPGDEFTVGMVGRFMPQKGYYVLMDAARKVLKTHKNIKFFLVGDGELKKSIQTAVIDENMSDNFHFFDETDDIASIYALLDCLVLPSLWEGCPYALLEAMAMGLPVIASSVGGIPEIINNETGVLVPPANAELLAEALIKLCENRDFAEKLGENGQKLVLKKFLLKDSVKKLENIYLGIAKNSS